MPCAWRVYPNGRFSAATGPDFKNPIQGLYPNCPFIAALSSLAWVNREYLADKGQETYIFHNGPEPVETAVNAELLVDNTGNLCGARSNDPLITWPGLCEKAYAKYCMFRWQGMSLEQLADPAVNPDPSALTRDQWGGNAATVLATLTGCRPVTCRVSDPRFTCTATNTQFDDFFLFLKTCFCNDTQKTRLPMVAWTYYDENANPHGVTYNTPALVANHAYSVLGVHEYDGRHYIVLRNPFGRDYPHPAILSGSLLATNWSYDDVQFPLCSLVRPIGLHKIRRIDLANQNDGIFGIEGPLFRNYFEAIGYVY